MNITKQQSGLELLVAVEGSIDSTSAPELNDQICDSLTSINSLEICDSLTSINSLVFDFSKVNYISSAGLRVLLSARKTLGDKGEVIIRHPNSNVLDVFTMSGFDNILKIEQ